MGPAGRRHAAGDVPAARPVRRLPASVRQQLHVRRPQRIKRRLHHALASFTRRRRGRARRRRSAGAQTKIDFFFPVPVDGKLAREMTRLVKVYNDSQKEIAVTAVYTGSYDDTKLKAQAAANAGKPPAVVLMSANFVLDLKLAGDVISLEPMLKADGTTRAKFLDDFWPARARQRHRRRRALRHPVPELDAAALLQQGALQGGRPRSREAAADLGRAGRCRQEADHGRPHGLRPARGLRLHGLDHGGALACPTAAATSTRSTAARSITTRPRCWARRSSSRTWCSSTR